VFRFFDRVSLVLSLLFFPAFTLSSANPQQNATPQPRVSGVVATDIVLGWDHTCVTTTTGRVQCWGANDFGELGDGSNTDRWTPVDVVGLGADVKAITEGRYHTCALMNGGGVKCWGANGLGQLGDGTNTDRWTPVEVQGLAGGAIAIVAGLSHTCALMDGGAVRCWGGNGTGQLGDGTNIDSWTATEVSGLSAGVTNVIADLNHTCALMDSGGVKCWGANASGQLGDGTNTDRWIPTDVQGLSSGVEAVVGRFLHHCALTQDGAVKCWGANEAGQLGDGTSEDRWTPVHVQGLDSGVKALATGLSHTCALMQYGGIKCWGANGVGELGDGTNTDRWIPVDVSKLNGGVMAVAGGFDHTCAIMNNGMMKCWGSNAYGQVGDGTNVDRWTPVDVQGLNSGVAAVQEGPYYTCSLLNAGGVKCWGANEVGQLGDGTNTDRWAPGNAFVGLLP